METDFVVVSATQIVKDAIINAQRWRGRPDMTGGQTATESEQEIVGDDGGVATESGYNGYFTIKDISETDPETGEVTYKIAVCDGKTWDAENQESEDSKCLCNSTYVDVPSEVFELDDIFDDMNKSAEIYLLWKHVPLKERNPDNYYQLFVDEVSVMLITGSTPYWHYGSAYARYYIGNVSISEDKLYIHQRHGNYLYRHDTTGYIAYNGVPVPYSDKYDGAFSVYDITDYTVENPEYTVRVRWGNVYVNGYQVRAYDAGNILSQDFVITKPTTISLSFFASREYGEADRLELKLYEEEDGEEQADIKYKIAGVNSAADIRIDQYYTGSVLGGSLDLYMTWYLELCTLEPEEVEEQQSEE